MMGSQLGTYAEILMGQSPAGETCNATGVGVPLLNGPTEFGRDHPTARQFTVDGVRFARPGDLLFCVRGSTTGKMNWADRDYAIGRGVAAIRHKSDPARQPLVRAVIEHGLPGLLQQATGSTFPNVSAKQIASLPWPSLGSEQEREVARLVSLIDDLINANELACEDAENLVGALYRAHMASAASVERVVLKSVAAFTKGVAYKSSDLQPSSAALVSLKALRRTGGYQRVGLKPFTGPHKPDQVVRATDSVVAQTDLTQGAEVVGRAIRIGGDADFTKLVASMDACIVRPSSDRVSPELLFALLSSEDFRQHCRAQANGTTVLHLPLNAVQSFAFELPDRQTAQMLTEVIRPLWKLDDALAAETETLKASRSTIRQRLLSGDIRIRLTSADNAMNIARVAVAEGEA